MELGHDNADNDDDNVDSDAALRLNQLIEVTWTSKDDWCTAMKTNDASNIRNGNVATRL